MNKIKTYCINLKTRPDRKEKMISELNLYSLLDYEFIDAIDGNEATYKGGEFKYKTEYGCYLSHLEALEKVANNNEICLILEDDVILDKNLSEKLPLYLNNLPNDWRVAYLGLFAETYLSGLSYKKEINDYWYNIKGQWCMFAYIVNPVYIKEILKIYKSLLMPSDHIFKIIQKFGHCYVTRPFLAYTYSDISSIRNNYVSFVQLKEIQNDTR